MLTPVSLSLETGAVPPNALRAGQTLQTTVQGQPGSTYLQVSNARVALPIESGFPPGTLVTVAVAESPQGLQLRVSAAPEAAPADPMRALTELLRQLDALPLAKDAAATLPSALPRREDTIAPLLRMLLTQSTVSQDMAYLAGILAEAHRENALPSGLYNLFMALWGRFTATDADGLTSLLKQLAQQHRTEARLAQAIQTGHLAGELVGTETDLRSLLEALARSGSLRAFLRQGKGAAEFDNAVSRILDRLTGTQYQNLHGHGEPYLFLEVPFPADSGMRRAQIHFLTEGQRDSGSEADEAHVVAFDLDTANLGALWVTLRVAKGDCTCHLRATSSETIQALREGSEALTTALRGAGYKGARLRVSRWDGNRVREVIALTRRFTGLNLSG